MFLYFIFTWRPKVKDARHIFLLTFLARKTFSLAVEKLQMRLIVLTIRAMRLENDGIFKVMPRRAQANEQQRGFQILVYENR
jgi:hypothetical protein